MLDLLNSIEAAFFNQFQIPGLTLLATGIKFYRNPEVRPYLQIVTFSGHTWLNHISIILIVSGTVSMFAGIFRITVIHLKTSQETLVVSISLFNIWCLHLTIYFRLHSHVQIVLSMLITSFMNIHEPHIKQLYLILLLFPSKVLFKGFLIEKSWYYSLEAYEYSWSN